MSGLLIILLQSSLSMALITLVYAALLPLLSKRYSAKWSYIVWLVIALGWIIPFRPQLDLPFLNTQISNISPVTHIQSIINAIPSITNAGNVVNASGTSSLSRIIGLIWIIGVVSNLFYHTLRHRHFIKIVHRWSNPINSLKYLGVLNNLKLELEINAHIKLNVCRSITSPMLIGFFHPTILLPPIEISDDEFTFVLKHELIHFRRHDLWYKALILAAKALHWFNPMVYLMARSAAMQCEISCDALVLQGLDSRQRKQYGEMIMAVVRNESKFQTACSTNFYGGKRGMKTRIFSIMDTSKKRAGIIILCAVIIGALTTGMAFAADSENNDNSANVSTDKQAETSILEPTETKVLDVPEITETELTAHELAESELTEPELAESELTEPELTKPERVVTYYKDGIAITEYIAID